MAKRRQGRVERPAGAAASAPVAVDLRALRNDPPTGQTGAQWPAERYAPKEGRPRQRSRPAQGVGSTPRSSPGLMGGSPPRRAVPALALSSSPPFLRRSVAFPAPFGKGGQVSDARWVRPHRPASTAPSQLLPSRSPQPPAPRHSRPNARSDAALPGRRANPAGGPGSAHSSATVPSCVGAPARACSPSAQTAPRPPRQHDAPADRRTSLSRYLNTHPPLPLPLAPFRAD